MNNVDLDTSIDRLSEIVTMSTKATNICRYNKLTNLYLILDHFMSIGNFLDIRTCGIKTNVELNSIAQKYILLYPFQNVISNEPHDSEFLPPNEVLSKNIQIRYLQKTILSNIIHIKIRTLSIRVNNALYKYLKGNLSFDTFNRQLLSVPTNKINKIKGMGKKSIVELKYFTNAINEYIDSIIRYNETELLRELYITYLQRYYRIEEEVLRKITAGYEFSNGIPIFKTIFYLSKFRKILCETEMLLFFGGNYRYIDFSADNLFLKLTECNVTRERIRQVNKYLPSKLHKSVNKIFMEDLKNYSLNTYSFDRQDDLIHVDSKLLQQIRTSEKISFTQQFVTFILSSLYDDSHFLLGDLEWFYPQQLKRRYFEWQNFYLINKRLENIFNFHEFIQSISIMHLEPKRRSSNNDQNIDFHNFLLRFFITNDDTEMITIANICKKIVHIEFPEIVILNE